VNGRFWGSLQLAIDAGVDFPRLLLDAALGRRPAPVRAYRRTRLRWLWGEIDHLLIRLRNSDAALSLPPSAPRRFAVLADMLRLWRSDERVETFRWHDPRPFIRETKTWLTGG
jgi:hypothetical protein